MTELISTDTRQCGTTIVVYYSLGIIARRIVRWPCAQPDWGWERVGGHITKQSQVSEESQPHGSSLYPQIGRLDAPATVPI